MCSNLIWEQKMNLGIRVNVDNYQTRARRNSTSSVNFKGATFLRLVKSDNSKITQDMIEVGRSIGKTDAKGETFLQLVKSDNSKITDEMIEAWRNIRKLDARKDQSSRNNGSSVVAAKTHFSHMARYAGIKEVTTEMVTLLDNLIRKPPIQQ